MDYYTFNIVEASFWVGLGMLAFVMRNLNKKYGWFSLFTSIILVTFGLSDIAEVQYGSFLEPGMQWLFVWKIINIIGIVYIFGWYVFLRSR